MLSSLLNITAVAVPAFFAGLIVCRLIMGRIIKKQQAQIARAREEAEQATSSKQRFLNNMTQEIKTPINIIMGMDEMILRENPQGVPAEYASAVAGYAKDIRFASETLLDMINDLFDISMIETGKMHLYEQSYNIADLLRSIVPMIRSSSYQSDLSFDVYVDPELPSGLYGDVAKIRQILLNLLTNAIKFTDKGGLSLRVSVLKKTDTSCGILFSVKAKHAFAV